MSIGFISFNYLAHYLNSYLTIYDISLVYIDNKNEIK